MIRPYHANDANAVLDIWLTASLQAHAFIAESFWRDQLAAMRDIYPVSYTHLTLPTTPYV